MTCRRFVSSMISQPEVAADLVELLTENNIQVNPDIIFLSNEAEHLAAVIVPSVSIARILANSSLWTSSSNLIMPPFIMVSEDDIRLPADLEGLVVRTVNLSKPEDRNSLVRFLQEMVRETA